jgi:hypothetical protein
VPDLSTEFDELAGPVSQGGGTGDVYGTVTGASVTLTEGRWLIRARASHVNVTGAGGVTRSSDVEVRHNTTRYGVSRWCSLFGSFRTSIACGGIMQTFFVIDAADSDTISMRLRRENVDGTDDGDVEAGDCTIEAILLDELVEGTDYWYADGGNSDTAEVVATDASWVTAAAAGRIGQDASEVDLTAPTTGDYWVMASIESFNDGTPGAAEEGRARLRIDGAAGGTGAEHTHTRDPGSPGAYWGNFFDEDVIALSATDTPEIQWEVANNASGDAGGFRRSRIFVLRLDALADYEHIVNAGDIQVASAGTTEGANGLTFNFGTTEVLISGTATQQNAGGNFGRSWLHQDAGDVHHPPSGRLQAIFNDGVGSGDDEMPVAFGTIRSSTGSETWRLATSTDSGANMYTLGRTRGNGGSARTILIAMQMATASGASLTGETAISTPLATITSSGRFNRSGTASISTPLATIAAAGGQERSGPVAISTPLPTIAASGRHERSGEVAIAIPLATVSAAGRFELTGEADMTIPLARIRARQAEPEDGPLESGPINPERVSSARVRGERVRGQRV